MCRRNTLHLPSCIAVSLGSAGAVVLLLAAGCAGLGDPRVADTASCGNRSYVRITAERKELLTSDTTKVIIETFTQGSYAPDVPVQLSASGGRFDDGAGPSASITTDPSGIGSTVWRAPSLVGLGSDDRGPWKYTIEALAFDACAATINIGVRR